MNHRAAHERLPDLLVDRDDPELVAHVAACHDCQQQLFRLTRVDRMLRAAGVRRRRRVRGRRTAAVALIAAVAAAAAAVVSHVPADAPSTAVFSLRTADGRTLGSALVRRQNHAVDRVVIVARGMPGARRQYLLWTERAGSAGRVPVGRFMVDRTGSCRVKFTLPAAARWRGFIVTTAGNPRRVVAST